jgi:hypothetical protein
MAPRHQPVEEETRKLIDRLLLEKMALLKQGMISSKRNWQKQLTKNLNL